jgi:putative transposase
MCVGLGGTGKRQLASGERGTIVQRDDGSYRKTRKSFNLPGQAHELTFSRYKRLPLLSKERSRMWFIDALRQARTRRDFDLWAYVIMPEHAHVLLLPRREVYDVAMIFKSIKQSVARKAIDYLKGSSPDWLDTLKVPTSTGRIEYRFWQAGGGYDRNIERASTAWHSVDYIHNNPVRRGLAARPTDWEWSSARCYAGEGEIRLAMDGRPPDV